MTSCPSWPIRVFYAPTIFPYNRIWSEFELLSKTLRSVALLHDTLLLLLLLLRPLLRGWSSVLKMRFADLGFGFLLRESACV